MDWNGALKRLLGVGSRTGEPGTVYRCLRCGSEYSRGYSECPTCGLAYVVEVSE